METIPAVITGGAAIIVAVVGVFGVLYGHLSQRLSTLEDELVVSRAYSRGLWAYCRGLLDLYYRHRREGAPDPERLPDEPTT